MEKLFSNLMLSQREFAKNIDSLTTYEFLPQYILENGEPAAKQVFHFMNASLYVDTDNEEFRKSFVDCVKVLFEILSPDTEKTIQYLNKIDSLIQFCPFLDNTIEEGFEKFKKSYGY